MVYYITFQLHIRPTDDAFIYKCIHSGIIHRRKIKSKYNVVQQSHYQIEYNVWVLTQDSRNTLEGSPCDIFQRLKTVN